MFLWRNEVSIIPLTSLCPKLEDERPRVIRLGLSKWIVCFESPHSFLFQCQIEEHTQYIQWKNVTFRLTMTWTYCWRLIGYETFSISKEKFCEIWKLMHFFLKNVCVFFHCVCFFASLAPSFRKKSWLKTHNLFWMTLELIIWPFPIHVWYGCIRKFWPKQRIRFFLLKPVK